MSSTIDTYTTPQNHLNYSTTGLKSFHMNSIEKFVVTNKAQVDLAWQLCIYLPLLLNPEYAAKHFTSSRYARIAKLPHIPLLVHILCGFILVFRYQYRAVSSLNPPRPGTFDIILGITNALVSWRLSKHEARGNPRLARVGFQVMSLMLFFTAAMCYLDEAKGAEWYHALVKMHNAFIYVRWLLLYGSKIGLWSGYHEAYSIGVFFGGILAVWEGRFPWDGILGVPVALAFHTALVVVERYTSSLITSKNSQSNPLVRLLLLVGLVEVGTYKKLKQANEDSENSKEVASNGTVQTRVAAAADTKELP